MAASNNSSRRPWRFAPLDTSSSSSGSSNNKGQGLTRLEGVIFDMDGTLCLPQNYMFGEMRAALGIARGVDILDHVRSLPDEPDGEAAASSSSPQSRARDAIRAIEQRAMRDQVAQPGLQALMAYLHARRVRKALCTRNFALPVAHLLAKFLDYDGGGDGGGGGKYGVFEPVVTRESAGIMPKPSPEGLWWIARAWGLDPATTSTTPPTPTTELGRGLIMVGDSVDDMLAGRRAGAATVLLVNDDNKHLAAAPEVDLVIRRLDELIDVLEKGLPDLQTTDD